MKNRILFPILALIGVAASSCYTGVTSSEGLPAFIPDSVRSNLRAQATIVAFHAAIRQDSSYVDSMEIPSWSVDRVYNSLEAVWLDRGSKERDSIFDIYRMHVFSAFDLGVIELCKGAADRPDVMQQILAKYQLRKQVTPTATEVLTPHPMNTFELSRQLNTAFDFPCAAPAAYLGDGDGITAYFEPIATRLEFALSYGDCPSGCAYRRVWSFRAPHDGNVEYLGVTGDPPPAPGER